MPAKHPWAHAASLARSTPLPAPPPAPPSTFGATLPTTNPPVYTGLPPPAAAAADVDQPLKKAMGIMVIVLMMLLVVTALWKLYRDDQQCAIQLIGSEILAWLTRRSFYCHRSKAAERQKKMASHRFICRVLLGCVHVQWYDFSTRRA